MGTRPEAIKMAPLLVSMGQENDSFTAISCVTGQHREMLDQALSAFDIHPDYDLNIMLDNQRLGGLAASVISGVDRIIVATQPDIMLVQGDTTTAFAAALAGFYARIPVGHVEAGLRTRDMDNPFPEEANRVLTDQIATVCFAPTERNRTNLLADGVPATRIHVTGNTGIDALRLIRDGLADRDPSEWDREWGLAGKVIARCEKPLVMITVHRRESFGTGLQRIFGAIRQLAEDNPDWQFVYPVHLNPNVREAAVAELRASPNVFLIDPLSYEPFVYLMTRASLILTDSGGVQEEAPSLQKPVIVLRDKTERQEAVEAGTVILAGTQRDNIVEQAQRLMNGIAAGSNPPIGPNPYGDGHAAERILEILRATC